ncbi:hypothetical protein BX600DRAFT_153344 [Xylariales sp. PMI_506]|nr:hypothetical protein BX600DRAFT_153344 [Xylariales sp. PMI_506]
MSTTTRTMAFTTPGTAVLTSYILTGVVVAIIGGALSAYVKIWLKRTISFLALSEHNTRNNVMNTLWSVDAHLLFGSLIAYGSTEGSGCVRGNSFLKTPTRVESYQPYNSWNPKKTTQLSVDPSGQAITQLSHFESIAIQVLTSTLRQAWIIMKYIWALTVDIYECSGIEREIKSWPIFHKQKRHLMFQRWERKAFDMILDLGEEYM